MKYYTGIGSRSTPEDVLVLMSKYARFWAEKGWVLRSGHADGADMAFEAAAFYAEGKAEIFLPWKSFNNPDTHFKARLYEPASWTYRIAEQFHPSWPYLKWGARKCLARNVHQIFGPDLDSPKSDFVCCWTKGAKGEGGTGLAIRIAKSYNIPVYDLGDEEVRDGFEYGMKQHALKYN